MIKTVYFDLNVFDHIRRRYGVTDIDLHILKAVVGSGELCILLSISLVEETLMLLKSSPDVAREMGQLLANLTAGSKVIKPHQELLRDDIRAYAKGIPIPEPFTTEFSNLIRYLNPSEADLAGRLAVIAEIEQAKADAQATLQAASVHDLAYFRALPKGSRPDFKNYYNRHALGVAADFADEAGVRAECEARGLQSLLQVRSVQMCIGAHLSLGYAQTREGQGVSQGDWHDMQHAELASAADVFVTQDAKLAKNLNRIGIQDFEVMDLQTLLQRVAAHYLVRPAFA